MAFSRFATALLRTWSALLETGDTDLIVVAVTVGVSAGSVFTMAGKGVCIAGDAGLIAAAVTVGVSAGSVFTTAGKDICIVGDVVIVGVVTPVLQPTKKTLIKIQMAVKGLSISRNKDGSLIRDVSKIYLYLAAQR